MRWFGGTSLIVTAMLALAGCGSSPPSPAAGAGSETEASSPTTPTVSDPLDGTAWRSTFTCDDVAKSVEQAGQQKYEAQILGQLECDGVMHNTFAFDAGALTITSSPGGTNPPIPYEVVDDHTYVAGFQRVTYRVRGDQLFLEMQIIAALYPYDPKIMPREQAFDIGVFGSVPYERVS